MDTRQQTFLMSTPVVADKATFSSSSSTILSCATTTTGRTTTTNRPAKGGSRKSLDPSKAASRKTPLGRVSITFDVGPGWKGTKSRDFPGRPYCNHERTLLQEWSKEFRHGIPCHNNIDDTRTVPNKTNNHRRKPFISADKVTRHCAYHWFRLSQKRLVDKAILKLITANDGSPTTTPSTRSSSPTSMPSPMLIPGSSYRTNGSDKKVTKKFLTRHLSLEIQLCPYPIQCLVPNVYDRGAASPLSSTMTTHSQFIEVGWCENYTMAFQEQVRAQYRIHVGVKSHGKATMQLHPVYLLGNGNGSFFQASDLPVGVHSINGCTFTVIDTGPSNKKKRKKRTRKAPKPTMLTNGMQRIVHQAQGQEKKETMNMNRSTTKDKRAKTMQVGAPVPPVVASFYDDYDPSLLPMLPFPAPPTIPLLSCTVKSLTPQVIILDEPLGERYVTVEWSNNSNNNLTPPKYLTIGTTTVELFTVGYNQCVFRAADVEVGTYVVDGVSLSVIRTPDPTMTNSFTLW